MSFLEKVGLPPRLVALCGLLWLVGAPMIALSAPCPANLPNNPNAITVQGGDPTGLLGYPLAVVSACPLDVNIAAASFNPCVTQCTSPWITATTDLSTTGTLTNANDTVTLTLGGQATLIFQMAPSITAGTATVVWEGTIDGSNWFQFEARNLGALAGTVNNAQNFNNATSTSQLIASVAGMTKVRLRLSVAATGSIAVTMNADSRTRSDVYRYNTGGALVNAGANNGGFADNLTSTAEMNTIGGGAFPLEVLQMQYTGASTAQLVRTPQVFKTATATASGNTAVWTPAAGKKFRLMRYFVQVTEDAAQAVAGDLEITFNDSGTAIGLGQSVYVPAASLVTSGDLMTGPWVDLGNGKLSAAANNVLNINLPAALTAGEVRVTVCGTEE